MVPKIDREDTLFDKQIADRINIKIEDLNQLISQMSNNDLEPKYDVSLINVKLKDDRFVNIINTATHEYSEGLECEYRLEVSFNVEMKSNSSYRISNKENGVNILTFSFEFKNIVESVIHESCGIKTKHENKNELSTGQRVHIGYAPRPPKCDVWFSTMNGTCLIHIPIGSTYIYAIPYGVSKVDVYMWYV